MKKIKRLLAILLATLSVVGCSFVVTGCSSANECKITYQLALPGGVDVDIKSTTQTVVYGEKYTLYTPRCSDSSYEFEGWKIKGTSTMVETSGNKWKHKGSIILVATWGKYTNNY
jgi:hypothetical protein